MKPEQEKLDKPKQQADADISCQIKIPEEIHTELIQTTVVKLEQPLEATKALINDELNDTAKK